jgi:homoserine O-succinyltransferase/O-acetyltransferase
MSSRANRESLLAGRGAQSHATGFILAEPCGDIIEIAFVNNMPDPAVPATEAQFTRLIQAGAGERPFRLRSYTLPGVPRSAEMRRHLLQTHEDIDVLFSRGADALIVTGTEPRAALLTDEPYWPDLARLADWARDHTLSSLWSCLAAHAVVQHLDGIARRRAPDKISGVYSFKTRIDDWPMRGAGSLSLVPHSRYNGLSRDDLERCGYTISSWSESAGVDIFWRREPSFFLFLQGHPEYQLDTLAREFRRDVIRFLAGEAGRYPRVPENYFSPQTMARLESARVRALTQGVLGCEAAINEILSDATLELRWSDDAARLYGNWLAVVALEKRRSALRSAAD